MIKKLNNFLLVFILFSGWLWLAALPAKAFDCNSFYNQFQVSVNGTKVNTVEGLPKLCSPEQAIGNVISVMLEFSGAVAVVFIVLGGYWYLASAGNEEQSEKGRKALTSAIIGLVIIILAFVLVRVTVDLLTSGLTGSGSTTTNTSSSGNQNNNTSGVTPTVASPQVDAYGLTTDEFNSYDGKSHLSQVTYSFYSGGSGGMTASSQVSGSDKQAVAQMETLCNKQFPPVLNIRIGYGDGSSRVYGSPPYQKDQSGNFSVSFNSTESVSPSSLSATNVQFWMCGVQFQVSTITNLH